MKASKNYGNSAINIESVATLAIDSRKLTGSCAQEGRCARRSDNFIALVFGRGGSKVYKEVLLQALDANEGPLLLVKGIILAKRKGSDP